MRSFLLLLLFFAACVPAPSPTFAPPPRPPSVGPTHEPTSPVDWNRLDELARGAAESGGHLEATFRLTRADAFEVERTIRVAPHACYTVGIAWSYPARAALDVMLTSGEGKHVELDPSVGTGSFCTDAAGDASLHVQALTGDHVIVTNELLEYAVAVAKRPESPDQAAARHRSDNQGASERAARMEANVYAAEVRDHGVAFARSCERCRVLDQRCRERPSADAGRCRLEFESCAQGVGTDRSGRILCNPSVR